MDAKKLEVPEGLELMASLPIGVSTPHEIDEEMARLLPGLEAKIAEFPRERSRASGRRRRTLIAVTTAAAAVLVAGFFVGRLVRGDEERAVLPATVVPRGVVERGAMLLDGKLASGRVDVLPGSRLGLASGLETGDGEGARLRADEGYELSLEERSAVRLLPGAVGRTELALSSGSVALAVPKLGDGESLEVVTEDARVIVHGTQFRVAIVESASGERRTCVEVTEGRVEVRRSETSAVFLGAGEKSGCGDEARAAEPRTRAVARSAGQLDRSRASTTLAEENALMTKALSAERANQTESAERHYQELLRRYPQSQFLPEARAGLARVRANL